MNVSCQGKPFFLHDQMRNTNRRKLFMSMEYPISIEMIYYSECIHANHTFDELHYTVGFSLLSTEKDIPICL